MNNKKSSSKIWTGILAVLLVLVMAGTAALVGVLSDGFKNWDKFKTEEVQTDETADNGGAIIGEGESNGISLISAKIATADYAANGISTMAETAYQLTATITPENADNKAVDWSVSFVNPSSSWANGKTVTDYVTVTPTSDGALTANLECKQAFGEQIKVTVTSRDNFNATATCTVDYAKRVKSASFKFWSPNNEDKTVVFEGDSSSVMVNYAAGSMLESFDAIKATVPYTRLEQTIEYTDYTVDDTYTLSVTAHENVALFEYLNTHNPSSEFSVDLQQYISQYSLSSSVRTVNLEQFNEYVDSVRMLCTLGTSSYQDKVYSLAGDFVDYFRTNSDAMIRSYTFKLQGSRNSYERTYTLKFNTSTLSVPVNSVSLGETNIIV